MHQVVGCLHGPVILGARAGRKVVRRALAGVSALDLARVPIQRATRALYSRIYAKLPRLLVCYMPLADYREHRHLSQRAIYGPIESVGQGTASQCLQREAGRKRWLTLRANPGFGFGLRQIASDRQLSCATRPEGNE